MITFTSGCRRRLYLFTRYATEFEDVCLALIDCIPPLTPYYSRPSMSSCAYTTAFHRLETVFANNLAYSEKKAAFTRYVNKCALRPPRRRGRHNYRYQLWYSDDEDEKDCGRWLRIVSRLNSPFCMLSCLLRSVHVLVTNAERISLTSAFLLIDSAYA